jgi:hypothetical protein
LEKDKGEDMLELKDAISSAESTLNEIYKSPDEMLFESADLIEERNTWMITFRVPLKIKPVSQLQGILGIQNRIFHKTVKIDGNGKILGIIDQPEFNQIVESESQSI